MCIGAGGERLRPVNGVCVCPSGRAQADPPGSGRYVCPRAATPRPTVTTRPTAPPPPQGPTEAQRIAAERAALDAQRRQLEAQRREADEAARAAAERERQATEQQRAAEAAQREAEEGRRRLQAEREAQERMVAERARQEEEARRVASAITAPRPLSGDRWDARVMGSLALAFHGVSLGLALWDFDVLLLSSRPACVARYSTSGNRIAGDNCAARDHWENSTLPEALGEGPTRFYLGGPAALMGVASIGAGISESQDSGSRWSFRLGVISAAASVGSLACLFLRYVPGPDDVAVIQGFQAAAIGLAATSVALDVVILARAFRSMESVHGPQRSSMTLRLGPGSFGSGLSLSGTF